MMIWKTAWKNVWRNKVRSLVVLSSVTIGIFAGVFSVAMMNGMMAQRVDAALNEELSHIQITNKEFRINNDPQLIINNSQEIISETSSVKEITGVVERTLITGMANTATKSAGVQIAGIDPEKEKEIFTLHEKIMPGTGDYFEQESRQNLALIGEDLAKDLNIIRFLIDTAALTRLNNEGLPAKIIDKLAPLTNQRFNNEKKFLKEMKAIFTAKEAKKYGPVIRKEAWSFREGSRFTLTFLDKDNNQVGAVFRLSGLYDVKNSMFEKSMVFVRNSDLKRLTGLDDNASHQIIIRLADVEQTDNVTEVLAKKFPDLDVQSWKKLQPDLAMMTDMVQQFYAIFMIIILAALAFGIVNTMLMVVLERTKELGMLTAIGMNKRRVFSLIMLESVFLSVVGGIAGMIVGYITILLTSKNGINLSQYAEGFEAYGYSAHFFPEIDVKFFIIITIMIIFTGIISSVYPALKALKLNPVEAIRTE
jgi:ABC-type lipoprotein release transport system permease subunit